MTYAEKKIFPLTGIEFEWSLLPDSQAPAEGRSTQDPTKVLRFIRFADSDYDTQKHIHDMELRSAHGSSCLVEGRNNSIRRRSVEEVILYVDNYRRNTILKRRQQKF